MGIKKATINQKLRQLPKQAKLLIKSNITSKILYLTLFTFITLIYFHNLNKIQFHLDEWLFMGKSYYFDLFFIKRNTSDPRWHIYDKVVSDPAQPKLGPFLFGAALHLSSINDTDSHLYSINYYQLAPVLDRKTSLNELHQTYAWLNSGGMRLIERIILPGRIVSTVFAIASLTLLSYITTQIMGKLYGVIATSLLATNSLVLTTTRRAMTDAMQLFFFLINILLLKKLSDEISSNSNNRYLFYSLLIGINLGLALSTKVVAILILPFIVTIYLFIFSKSKAKKQILTAIAKSTIVILISATSLFVALHPFLYQKTARRTIGVFTNRFNFEKENNSQSSERPVQNRFFAVEVIYQNLLFRQGSYSLFKHKTIPVNFILFVSGALLLLKKALSTNKKQQIILSYEMLLLTWMATTISGLWLYLYGDWPRYYLPAFITIVLIQAYAITAITLKLKDFIILLKLAKTNKNIEAPRAESSRTLLINKK